MDRRDFLWTTLAAVPAGQARLSLFSITSQSAERSRLALEVRLSATAAGRQIEPYWKRCVGAGRANEGLRANWQEQLKLCVTACGFQYLRFHGLFHDDMFVYREISGKPEYNWQYIDELYDRMLAMGIRPFVELTFFPKDIANDDGTFAWWRGHGTPPKDFSRWTELIVQFIQHCQFRYGKDEIRKWYYEIWNEPNLRGFWNGTQEQFFAMYKEVALAVKAIDPALRIGGPSTSSFHPDQSIYQRLASKKNISAQDFVGVESKGPWIEDFLAFCEKEALPLDFVSAHPYPTSYPIDSVGNQLEVSRPVTSTQEDIMWLRKTMAKTKYAKAEIHLTEWSSSPSISDYTHDYPQEATYIVKVNLDCLGLANSLSYWIFTDLIEEAGGAASVFNGGFGLVNFQGIVKPAFHAYRMLNRLGQIELHREDGCIVTKHTDNGRVTVLAYNYPTEVLASAPLSRVTREVAEKTLATGSSREAKLFLTGLPPNASFMVETLDSTHGFAFRDWQAMGNPEPPTREQTLKLREIGMATKKETLRADTKGELVWKSTISPWAVILIDQI